MDYLFDELSNEEAIDFEHLLDEDTDLAGEVSSFGETLDAMRELEAEDPPEWLASKVMAEARQVAEVAENSGFFARLRKFMWGPTGGLVGAAVAAMGLAFVMVPQMVLDQAPQSPDEMAFEMAGREMESAPVAVAPAAPKGEAMADSLLEKPTSGARKEDQAGALDSAAEGVGSTPPPPADVRPAPKAPKNKARPAKKARRARRRAEPRRQPAPRPAVRAGAAAGATRTSGPVAVESEAPPPRGSVADKKDAKDFDFGLAPTIGDSDEFAEDSAKAGEKKQEQTSPLQLAKDLIRAAETDLQRGQVDSARRVLERAVERLKGHPAQGWVLVRRARLELAQSEYRAAKRYARAAIAVPSFGGKAEAHRLLAEISRASQPPPAAAPVPR